MEILNLAQLEKLDNRALDNLSAEYIMGWYWGETMFGKEWMEGPIPESGNFVWDLGVPAGYAHNWMPTSNAEHLLMLKSKTDPHKYLDTLLDMNYPAEKETQAFREDTIVCLLAKMKKEEEK